MTRRIVASLLCLAATTTTADKGPQQPAPERLLHGWLDVFNAGDPARFAKFRAEHVSPKLAERRSLEETVRAARDLRDEIGGGFDLFKVVASAATEVKALLRERGGFGYAQLTITVAPGAPDRIDGIDLRRVP